MIQKNIRSVLDYPTPIEIECYISGRYRYYLKQRWESTKEEKAVLWICYNPSIADSDQDDRTVGRMRAFTRRWGRNCFYVCNLFARIETNPDKLCSVSDPIGPENDRIINKIAGYNSINLIVAAWSSLTPPRNKQLKKARIDAILKLIGNKELSCFGYNEKNRSTMHPLYKRSDSELVRFPSSLK